MITYSLLMTVGVIAFVVGIALVLWNLFRIKNSVANAFFNGDSPESLAQSFGKRAFTHIIGGVIAWMGAVSTVAGFIWFLVVLISAKR